MRAWGPRSTHYGLLIPRQGAGVEPHCPPGLPSPLEPGGKTKAAQQKPPQRAGAVAWAAQREATQTRHGFLILFIEEKKRREKIDSPPLLFPEWASSPAPGVGAGEREGCALHLGLGRGPGPPGPGKVGGGGLAASRGVGVSKKWCQASWAKQAGPVLRQLREASWGCRPHLARPLSAAARPPARRRWAGGGQSLRHLPASGALCPPGPPVPPVPSGSGPSTAGLRLAAVRAP